MPPLARALLPRPLFTASRYPRLHALTLRSRCASTIPETVPATTTPSSTSQLPEYTNVSASASPAYSRTAASSSSSPLPEPELEPLTYHVHRTPSQQLPVYHLAKRAGSKHLTRIRKITGNVQHFREDLTNALSLPEKDVVVNELTGHVVVKGWKKHEVAAFLESKRF